MVRPLITTPMNTNRPDSARTSTSPSSLSPSPRGPILFLIGLSAVACLGLIWLIYFTEKSEDSAEQLPWLPMLNAILNGCSACCVVLGIHCVRKGSIVAHRRCMLAAFGFSTLFLVSYISHHYLHGDARFAGEGLVRPVYFFILISHILLSVICLPLVLITFYAALSDRIPMHRRLVRWTAPLWLYVSVTGVLVVVFLKIFGSS